MVAVPSTITYLVDADILSHAGSILSPMKSLKSLMKVFRTMDVDRSFVCCELLVLFIAIGYFGANCQDFGYDGVEGPTHWGEKYSECLGKYQSPIDIETLEVVSTQFLPLVFYDFSIPLQDVMLKNNGHTVVLKSLGGPKPKIYGGPLNSVFEFSQLHFHWGANDTTGSENRINHHSYPLEMHIVMFNTKYPPSEAAKTYGGLTVLSFLTSVSEKDNKNYDQLEEGLHEVQPLSSNKTFHHFGSLDSLTTMKRGRYFTYAGSLTTPPCSETVTWIEFVNTIPLSRKQINSFRQISSIKGRLTHNFRPVQPTNGRLIYYNSTNTKYKANVWSVTILLFILMVWNCP